MINYSKISLVALLLAFGGCGDDEPPAPKPAPKPAAKKKKKKKRGGGSKEGSAKYLKIEQIVAEKNEELKEQGKEDNLLTVAEKRFTFGPDTFIPDPDGTDNRDPFRSYLISPNVEVEVKQPTEQCRDKRQIKASTETIQNLTLSGIIRRGSSSVAQFRDSRGNAHLVRRNDCLGSEKIKIKEISAEFVKTEQIPPNMVDGGKTIIRKIFLHPAEEKLTESKREQDE